MPNLFSNLSECFGFSQITKLAFLIVSIALWDISPRFPMGVATIYKPEKFVFILFLFIFIISCSPVNLNKAVNKKENLPIKDSKKTETGLPESKRLELSKNIDQKQIEQIYLNDESLDKNITILLSKKKKLTNYQSVY